LGVLNDILDVSAMDSGMFSLSRSPTGRLGDLSGTLRIGEDRDQQGEVEIGARGIHRRGW
jgi:hypothetical protein